MRGMDILEELSAMRLADAEELEKAEPYGALEARAKCMAAPLDFAGAFAGDGLRVIAEIKRASPSEGMIREDFDPVAIALAYEAAGAAAISVLCEPHRFLGSDAHLEKVRAATGLPILYKDFITSPYQIARARACGADAVLLIAAVLDDRRLADLMAVAKSFGMAALVETHTEEEAKRAAGSGARVVGVNCRDLRTFRTDPSLTAELVAKLPAGTVRIAESGMKTRADLLKCREAGADGFLVGTALMRAENPGAKLAELVCGDDAKGDR